MDEYYHNITLENLLSQVDEDGRELILTRGISYHNIDKSVIREWKKDLITKKVWKLPIKWKYVTHDCIPLKDIIEYNPVETT